MKEKRTDQKKKSSRFADKPSGRTRRVVRRAPITDRQPSKPVATTTANVPSTAAFARPTERRPSSEPTYRVEVVNISTREVVRTVDTGLTSADARSVKIRIGRDLSLHEVGKIRVE